MTAVPRGRHGLSRDEVGALQRSRMFTAMADAMAERGYVATPVAEIIKRAGVSRETFYQQFDSKQDCFVAALEETIDRLGATLESAVAAPGRPLERLDRLLGAYLDQLVAAPAAARLILIESYAAGPEVLARRADLDRRFVTGLADLFGVTSERERFACEALVHATVAMATVRVGTGDLAGLSSLREPLVALAASIVQLSHP